MLIFNPTGYKGESEHLHSESNYNHNKIRKTNFGPFLITNKVSRGLDSRLININVCLFLQELVFFSFDELSSEAGHFLLRSLADGVF